MKCCCSKACVDGCLKNTDLTRRNRKFQSEDIFREYSIEWLSSLYKKSLMEQEYVQKNLLPEIESEEADLYKERLQERVQTLRNTIDFHLKTLYKGNDSSY
jgi:hypothetical protein